jgi:hypothetical protein
MVSAGLEDNISRILFAGLEDNISRILFAGLNGAEGGLLASIGVFDFIDVDPNGFVDFVDPNGFKDPNEFVDFDLKDEESIDEDEDVNEVISILKA